MNYARIRYEVILSTETFFGPDHKSGAETVNYRISIPMGIYENSSGQLSWAQEPDRDGHIDPRLPASGSAEFTKGDLVLTHWAGNTAEAVGVLVSFYPKNAEGPGLALFSYMQKKVYAPANLSKPASQMDWRGKGTWNLLDRRWATSATDYVFSDWTFSTAGGGGGGILLAASGGKFVLIDPYGREWSFYYGGIGVGAGLKGMSVKGLKIPTQIPVGNARLGTGTMSATGGPTAFSNVGKVLKNPLWVVARELTANDFLGTCTWVDGAAVVGGGVGGAFMFLGVNPLLAPLGPMAAMAIVPSIGWTAGLGIGAGGYIGRVFGAW